MKSRTIFLLLLFAFLLTAAAKYDFRDFLQRSLTIYNEKNPREKIYIQTDKTYYRPMETIWYKGFLLDGNNHKTSPISDVMYVELYDSWGNMVQRHEQLVLDGTCQGAFYIPEDKPGGLYTIKAYTTWLKNEGEEAFFTKEITVQKVITPRILLKLDFEKRAYGANDDVVAFLKVTDLNNNKTENSVVNAVVRIDGREVNQLITKTQEGEATIRFRLPETLETSDGILQVIVKDKGVEESITQSIPIVLNKIKISFYPESGSIVEGVESKIAFEALNEFGKGADVSGEIVDEQGKQITTFESFHLGMGAFEFIPQQGKTYFAKINKPQNNLALISLPEPEKYEYLLQLTSKDDKQMQWRIYSPDKRRQTMLVGVSQGEIYYSQELNLQKGWSEVTVPTNEFPMGIAVFTLLVNEIETAERLVFINPQKKLNIELKPDKEIYAPEDSVKLTVKTTDEDGNPVAANIGLAVVDEQLLTMANDKQDNLLSYLLFSSELKGEIQEPSFYFDKEEPKAKEAIDYLMLTHGWRKLFWKPVLYSGSKQKEYLPEKTSSIYGYVHDKTGNPVQAEVFLIELSGKKRIVKLKTTPEGHFVFHNVDFQKNTFVTTKLPNQVYVLDKKPAIVAAPVVSNEDNLNNDFVVLERGAEDVLAVSPRTILPENREKQAPFSIVEQSSGAYSDQSLNETVVVAYGASEKKSLTSSVTQIIRDHSFPLTAGSIDATLIGSVAGVSISPSNISPGQEKSIRIRGIASTMDAEGPLFVVNGIPMSGSYTDTFGDLNPDDISEITILKDAASTAVFGSRGANGVILISTKDRKLFPDRYISGKSKYGGTMATRRLFYKPLYYSQIRYNKEGTNSTVYWNGELQTDKTGTAQVQFKNNKQSSTFRITAEAVSSAGLIGSETQRIVAQKPLSVDTKFPLYAGTGDEVKLPMLIKNNTDSILKTTLSVFHLENMAYLGQRGLQPLRIVLAMEYVAVPPGETQTVFVPVEIPKFAGKQYFSIEVESGALKDELTQGMEVKEINFPYSYSYSNDTASNINFVLPDYIEGSLQAEAVTYIQVLDELMDGVESIFRSPSGCFEQVSSSTFPNIFALQLLQSGGYNNPDVEAKAKKYLELGYSKLAAYEVKSTGGFEWYGGSPAHEVLSAYGLIEFHEMKKVYGQVDMEMMDRALNFILSRKDGKGGFKQNNGRYGFSSAPKDVNNAYIVYALTEIGHADKVELEYQAALNEALTSKDMYRMSLMANAAYNKGDMTNYRLLINEFDSYIQKGKFSSMKIQASIVYGSTASMETTAFWLLALLKDKTNSDINLIDKCVSYINSNKRGGGFGNTQSTSICLQALARFAGNIKKQSERGSFCVDVNEQSTCKDMSREINKNKAVINFTNQLNLGNNQVKVYHSENSSPYSVNISWYSATPPSGTLCPLQLTTRLASNSIKVNETVRLSVELSNKESVAKPMSIAVIGIPGGLSLQPWQLKELQEKEVFDFYEIIDDNLVIYYRELGPKEKKIINLDLKAETPGKYTGMASSAYIYYANEHKCWINGISVIIR